LVLSILDVSFLLKVAGRSFFMCLLWTEMGAVDVAFTEAAVGAGISTVLFIAAVNKTARRSKD